MRFLVFHKIHGIYLGGQYWSLSNPGASASAPTFEPNDQLYRMVVNAPADMQLSLVEAHPSLPGFRCSPDDCANVNLPRWGKDGSPTREDAEGAKAPTAVGSGKRRLMRGDEMDTTTTKKEPKKESKEEK